MVDTATAGTSPSTTVEPPPLVDFTKEPFLTFAPVPPQPAGADLPLPDGLDDFHALFDDDAPWAAALERLDGFKLHSWMIRHYLTDDELVRIGDFLQRHEIALIIEAEPLDPPDPADCPHMESFEGPSEIENAQRLSDLGVTPAAYAIEQPFSYGYQLDTPEACRYSLARVLDEVVDWAGRLRAIFPEVQIGSIEAIWDRPLTTPEDFGIWIDAYTEAMGEPPAFQHVDVNWAIPNWQEILLGIEEVVESRGVPFGPLYNGWTEPTNDAWIERTIQHIADFELVAGGTPGQVTIQSWYPQPDRGLPETDITAMTHLINRYGGARPTFVDTSLTDGVLAGRLIDQADRPLGGLAVSATTPPGPGTRQTITMTGKVPNDVAEALFVYRANFEDSIDVAADVTIHSISYVDGTADVVPNGSFSTGLDAWGVYDDNEGDVSWVRDAGDGAMRISAAQGARVLVDGPAFPVTPGATYTVEVDITVADGTSHGSIGLGFLVGDTEITRVPLDLRAHDRLIGTAATADDGTFAIEADPALAAVLDGSAPIAVSTPGDVATWPASSHLG